MHGKSHAKTCPQCFAQPHTWLGMYDAGGRKGANNQRGQNLTEIRMWKCTCFSYERGRDGSVSQEATEETEIEQKTAAARSCNKTREKNREWTRIRISIRVHSQPVRRSFVNHDLFCQSASEGGSIRG